MSKSHFMRFFKNVTGQGFVTYRHHLRIVRAESLLATTDMSIAELCQQVGYCDQSYFGVVFRKLAHMTPRQYRRQFCEAPADHGLKQKQLGLQAEDDARAQGLRVLSRYMERTPGEPSVEIMQARADPFAGRESANDFAIEAAGMLIIDVLNDATFFELGQLQTACEGTVLLPVPLAIHQESESLLETELAGGSSFQLFAESIRHAV
jgi:hypothetical protein